MPSSYRCQSLKPGRKRVPGASHLPFSKSLRGGSAKRFIATLEAYLVSAWTFDTLEQHLHLEFLEVSDLRINLADCAIQLQITRRRASGSAFVQGPGRVTSAMAPQEPRAA